MDEAIGNGLVSVIMPVFNAERFVAQALASVAAQTYSPVELLVVDGGSTDGTEALVQAYAAAHGPVRWLRQTGSGLAAAWNSGLAAATGEWVAFLDSDDLLPTSWRSRRPTCAPIRRRTTSSARCGSSWSRAPPCPRP